MNISTTKKICLGSVLAASILLFVTLSGADPVPVYHHVAVNEALSIFLQDMLNHFGIRADISQKVKGEISGRFVVYDGDSAVRENLTAYAPSGWLPDSQVSLQFPFSRFNSLAKQFGLVWYFFENTMYINTLEEVQSEIVVVESVPIHEFESSLKAVGIHDPRYPLRFAQGQRFVYASGPPKYLALIKEVASNVISRNHRRIDPVEAIRVFKLMYAWADDRTIQFRTDEILIPGVATLLKNILGVGAPAVMRSDPKAGKNRYTLPKLKGKGLAAASDAIGREENIPGSEPAAIHRFSGGNEVSIQADARLNAVIIRDTEEKMPTYEKLIAELDQPAGLVEIKVSIIDVNSDKVDEVGIDWLNVNRWKDGSLSTGFKAPKAVFGEDGLTLRSIIGGGTNLFFGAIHALAKEGQAEVISRPSVLTLNNAEAIFEESHIAYVRVAGNQEVDLFNVTTGVLVKVTPHIIEKDNRRLIKLSIEIKDGTLSDVSVDGIPVVEQSTINTQAVVGQTESLLIGGMTNETHYKNERKIPLLGDIPLIGNAFKTSRNEKGKRSRLFLITPRIIDDIATSSPLMAEEQGVEGLQDDSALLPPETSKKADEHLLVFDDDFTKEGTTTKSVGSGILFY